MLESYLTPDGPGEAHVLVWGPRGIGKSMLSRKVIMELVDKWGIPLAEADCASAGFAAESVLRKIARSMADEVIKTTNDHNLSHEAQLLGRLAAATEVKARDIRTWSDQLKIGISATSKLLDSLGFEFGMARAAGRSKEVEESFKRTVDASFLRDLIADFASDCARARQKLLIFVDNLDQSGYPARREDYVNAVTEIARFLFTLKDVVVLITLREEFVPHDMQKGDTHGIYVSPMKAAELLEVASKRIALAGERQQRALKEVGIARIADVLSGWTGNPWGFLKWLAEIDQTRTFDLGIATSTMIRDALLQIFKPYYPSVTSEELMMLGRAFRGQPEKYLTPEHLREADVSDQLRGRAIGDSALIPDWLLNPRGYSLPPPLHFLAHSS